MSALDCPVCGAPFREMVRDSVLVDVCTGCHGVWLDRGELDKLLAIAQKAEHEVTRGFNDDGYPRVNKKVNH